MTISGTISDVLLFFLKSPLLLSVNNKKEKILRIFLKYATIMLIKVVINHCESKRVKLYGDSKKGVLLQFAKALVVIYT